MTFAASSYAWLLFMLPAIALLKIWADNRAQRSMESFASSERIRNNLLGGASPVWSGLHFGLQLLGLAFFVIALTRPQLGIIEKEINESGRNIFIAIDTSKSMLAQDVKPDRLTRAKLAAQDLLDKLAGDRVGLIAFAGRSFLQAPLTTDHEAVTEAIQSLDHSTIPRGGSSLAAAIELAVKTADDSDAKRNGLIIFTDGQETDEATVAAAQKAKEAGLLILPVGVGTTQGDVIPDPEPDMRNNSGYVVDADGNIVHSRLESGLLKDVARISGGEYAELASQALTRSMVSNLTAKLDAHEAQTSQETRQAERYQFPLFVGMLLMALSLFLRPSSRKRIKATPVLPVDPKASVHARPHAMPLPATGKTLALLCLLGICMTSSLTAAINMTPKQQLNKAREEYKNGNYKEARDVYTGLLVDEENRLPKDQLAYALGASNLKIGDEDQAIYAFSRSLRSHDASLQLKSLRALGNVLYEKGAKMVEKEPNRALKIWEDSLTHLGTALQRDAEDQKTLDNYDFVKEQMEKLKKQIEQQQQQQQGQNGQQGDQPQPGQGNGQGQPRDQDGQQGDKGDKNGSGQDAMQEEQQAVPEGQISAGDGGEPVDEQKQKMADAEGEDENKRNDVTGFTPQEARSQLRSYAGDQNSVQYLMRREPPQGGKDY